jgi:hypothetical protein
MVALARLPSRGEAQIEKYEVASALGRVLIKLAAEILARVRD